MGNPDHTSALSDFLAKYVDHVRRTPLRELMPSLLYPSFLPNTPSVLVLRVPDELRVGPKRSSGRLSDGYKAVLIETQADRRFVEDALSRPLVVRNNVILMKESIDKTNLRRSQLPASASAGFLHYAPGDEGWPHLLVTMSWAPLPIPGLLRERYAVGYYETEAEIVAAMKHIAGVSGQCGVPMEVMFGGGV